MALKGVGGWVFVILILSGLISLAPSTSFTELEKPGAEYIDLFGGTRGNVRFPHRNHQQKLCDCNLCHAVFPQASGSIEDLKAKGILSTKQVMNKLCIKCHRDKKKEGIKSGPTTCSKCHSG